MKEKVFNITSKRRAFFRQYPDILSVFHPLDTLRKRELDLLGELLYYNDRYKSLNIQDRNKVIYDTKTRTEIREFLEMSEASFNNNLSILRKSGAIRDNIIVPHLAINPGDEFSITFKFKII